MSVEHEDPETPYEVALARYDADCARYGCWQPRRLLARDADGFTVGFCCREHAGHLPIVAVLET